MFKYRPSYFLIVTITILLIVGYRVLAIERDAAPVQSGKPVIWRDPGEVAKLDFDGGAGGRDNAPQPPFAFIEESSSGSYPRIRVSDAKGVKWTVKFGPDVNGEVFATRIAWAVGYFVDPAYFVRSGKIDDLGDLTRSREFIKPDGGFVNARFERQRERGVVTLKDEQSWSWVKNPFVGSKELNGLKVIMMLVSNRDNRDLRDVKRGSNTAIYQYSPNGGVEDRFLVTEWGGSMGRWGGNLSREKWDCKGYTEQTPAFVKGIRGDYFVWGYSGQHTKDLTDGIRIGDVRWLIEYLGQITDDQLRAGLQSSGAAPDEVECFTRAIRDRINQIKSCLE